MRAAAKSPLSCRMAVVCPRLFRACGEPAETLRAWGSEGISSSGVLTAIRMA